MVLAERGHIESAITFGESLPLSIAQKRQMNELRWSEAQQLRHIHLLWRREQQVATTNHLGDSHQGIINDHRQLIGPGTILATDDEVTHMMGQIDALRAIVSINKRDVAIGHDESRGSSLARLWRQVTTSAGIDHTSITLVRRLRGQQVGSRTITRIGHALILQHLEIMLINIGTLTLIDGLTVPRESQPLQIVHQQVGISLSRASWVNILNTQKPFPTLTLDR